MNLFQLASRGIDLDALPDESAPEREPLAFEPSPAGSRFAVPQEFDAAFQAAGDEYGVDPDVLRAMAFAESRFRPDVISGQVKSRTGAAGLMQFMPGTAERFGINPLDPVESIFGAAAYMRANLEKFDGDYGKAVAAYNWGENRKAYDAEDWQALAPKETQGYLKTVFGAADELKLRAPKPMPPVVPPPKGPEAAKTDAAIPERSWGEAVGDTTKSLAQGLLDVASLPGVAYSAVTGDYDTGYLNAIKGTQEVLQDQKSPEMQARNKALQDKLSTAEGWRERLAVGGIETLKDPTLLADTLLRSAPGMAAGGLAGRAAGALAGQAGNAAMSQGLTRGAETLLKAGVAAKNAAPVVASATAVGTSAATQGASVAKETFDELMKLPAQAFSAEEGFSQLVKEHGEEGAKSIVASAAANRALAVATATSVASMKLVPGGDAIEKMFLPAALKGSAREAAKVASANALTKPLTQGMQGGVVSKAAELLVQGGKTGALESMSEGLEESTGAMAKGLELSRAGQRVNLSEMAGEAYGQGAAAGLVMGKVAGMQEAYGSRAPRVEDQPTTPQAPIVPSAPVAPQAPQSAQTDVAAQILQAEAAQPQATGLAAELEVLRARSAPAPDFTQRSTTPQAQPGSVPVTGGLAAELQALRARSSPQEAANAPQRTPSDTQQQAQAPGAQAADVAGVNAPVPTSDLSGAGVAATQAAGVDIPTTQGVPANVPQPAQPGTQASQTQSTQGTTTGARVVLQNRDRSTPSSIAQMRSIAARPDYGRLGFSRDFANGAPVVAGGTIQPAQLGRQDVATASDGRRIPVQYAVVDAGSVLTSNTVDGTSNPSYGDSNIPAVRAIAGNGRIAGLQSAYQSGNANAYRQELVQDASLHGIAPEVIAPMAQPVLVRVMPAEAVTADIGDISNTVGNLDLSAVEQANNDANRVQLEALQFADDGSITTDAVRQFVRAMPQSEQGQLLDTNGQPTRQAVDRLSAAVFAKAYGNEALTRLYSQAQDPEARLVMSALAQVAPKMARLEGAGALDIRDVVAQAAEIAVNARRQGVPLARAAQQLDIAADPAVSVVLDLFAANSRTVRPVVEALARAADAAYTEANKPAEDMFGAVPRATRADIINQLRPENERRSQEALEDAAGRESAAVDAVGQANDPAGSAAPAEAQAGRPSEDAAAQGLNRPAALTSQAQTATESVAPEALELAAQTPAEAAARQDAQEQADKAEAAAKRAEDAAAKAEEERKRIAQASVRAADSFELGQDPMDSLTGQGGLMFSRTGAKSPNAQQPTTRAWYDRFVSLLPASYRNDPHRREPFPAEDWNVQRASEVRSKVEALNKQLRGADDRKGYGPVSVDGLGNLQVDARSVSAADLSGPIRALADELGAGVAATNVRSGDVLALLGEGFVSETSLAAIADRLMGRPFAQPVNTYTKDFAPGAILTYRPRGFPAVLFSFAGARAATADSSALVTAQDRLNAGEDAEAVRKETGWHKGVDGKWRFEISDADARLKDRAQWTAKIDGINAKLDAALQAKWQAKEQRNDFLRARGESPSRISSETKKTPEFKALAKALKNAEAAAEKAQDAAFLVRQGDSLITVGDVLSHPALFAAYPGIANVRVDINDSLPAGNAAYAYELRAIELSGKSDAQQLLSTLLHEIQHGIQHIEGFAMGGTPQSVASILEKERFETMANKDDALTAEFDALKRQYAGVPESEIPQEVANRVRQLRSEINAIRNTGWREASNPFARRQPTPEELFAGYTRLAGEVEARNTQARQGMTDAQRRATPPNQTADVADSEVIVVFNGKEMANAPMPANAAGAKTTTPIRDYGANYEALAGKDVTYTVPTTEGGTASMTVDAQSVLTQYDQRMQALETLRKCL